MLLILGGCLFELFLFGLCFVFPRDSSPALEVKYYLYQIHSPLLRVLIKCWDSGEWPSVVFRLLSLFLSMAVLWAILFKLALALWTSLQARIQLFKHKLIVRWSLGLVGAIVVALVVVKALPATPIRFRASPEVKSAVEGNTAFALDLYQKLKEQPGNLFFSPYGISSALAMTWAGARNQTEIEMARTLHFNLPQEKLDAAFGALSTRMNQVQHWNHVTLTTANALWCQRDYPFAESFLNLVRTDYDADARQADFKNAAQAARGEINDWVLSKTKGNIKGIIAPGQITPETRLILCNAIYFKGKWQTQFEAKYTKPAPFYIETNQTVTVPMMRQEDAFKMARSDDDSLEMLELPYQGADLSMIILLPMADLERSTLSDLEQKLSPENLHSWLEKLDQAASEETSVDLPRFETTESLDLTNDLMALGMASTFSSNADFSGMDPKTNLFITDVLHKAFLKVDEAGTEASAAASIRASALMEHPSFIANHPFIFLIRDNGSGSILFLGRVVDPTK